jgi:small subunit ribosomal protein S1
VDAKTQQIALGLKQLTADPWSTAAEAFAVGQVCHGRVDRVAEFGVFVRIAPDITGLVPASETGVARGQDLRKAFPVDREVDVIVLDVDVPARRIRLSVKDVATAEEAAEVREYTERADLPKAESMGSLADKLRGALGARPGHG